MSHGPSDNYIVLSDIGSLLLSLEPRDHLFPAGQSHCSLCDAFDSSWLPLVLAAPLERCTGLENIGQLLSKGTQEQKHIVVLTLPLIFCGQCNLLKHGGSRVQPCGKESTAASFTHPNPFTFFPLAYQFGGVVILLIPEWHSD